MTIEKSTVAIGIATLALTVSLATLAINCKYNKHQKIRHMFAMQHMMQQPQMQGMHKCNKMKKKFKQEKIENKFTLIDTNKDGNISKEEWLNHAKDFSKNFKQAENKI